MCHIYLSVYRMSAYRHNNTVLVSDHTCKTTQKCTHACIIHLNIYLFLYTHRDKSGQIQILRICSGWEPCAFILTHLDIFVPIGHQSAGHAWMLIQLLVYCTSVVALFIVQQTAALVLCTLSSLCLSLVSEVSTSRIPSRMFKTLQYAIPK